MLRRIRAKLLRSSLPARPIRLSSSAAHARANDNSNGHHGTEHHSEPYGMEYGAGPSRLPYQPPRQPQPLTHPSDTLRAADVSHRTARNLRHFLPTIKEGTYAQPKVFLSSIFKQREIWSAPKSELSSITRLELHTLVHHLIRKKKGNLAAAIVWEALSATPRHRRRRLLAQRTISTLFRDRSIFYLTKADSHVKSLSKRRFNPSLEEQVSPPPHRDLQILLDILETMQDVRYRRPAELYELIILQCVAENQFDLAAKIYVGLVEEWVTEGRVAHGADPDDFHPGGGPPREAEEGRIKMSELLAHWWTGVRTWRFPGEVLSPHDRLDLWHPKHLSLGEKMKNFPLPLATSPPTMVPQPRAILLSVILNALRLDPKKASPAEFASSMRALSILANTVLSRTLPIFGLGRLLQAFKSAPHKPDVFPDNVTSVPTENAWAYTAYTQIQVTLMSLLFSPPISSHSMMMIAANQDAENDLDVAANAKDPSAPASAVSQYMLPPLSWRSCTVLLQYAFAGLKRPQLLTKLLTYMKDVFQMGGKDPKAYNEVLQGASKMRDNDLARQADIRLFGATDQISQDRPSHAPLPDSRPDHREARAIARVDNDSTIELSSIELPIEGAEQETPLPDEDSIIRLINHLTVTSQFKRLEQFVYQLEPFLDFSKSQTVEEIIARMEAKGVEAGYSGRPRSQGMTPWMYVAILRGLEKAGSTGLAQRIYHIALWNERRMAEKAVLEGQSAIDPSGGKDGRLFASEASLESLPQTLRLPLDFFIIMQNVWANEGRAARRSIELGYLEVERPVGWQVITSDSTATSSQSSHRQLSQSSFEPRAIPSQDLPRSVAAGLMAVDLHATIKSRFSPHELTMKYFESYIRACRWRWKLTEEKPIFTGFRGEVVGLVRDMEASGNADQIPDFLVAKVWKHKPQPREEEEGKEDGDEGDDQGQTSTFSWNDGGGRKDRSRAQARQTRERELYERILGEEDLRSVEEEFLALRGHKSRKD
ncbi:hypothetical protein IAU59_003292 [Kwoniella sp. CBS 9459]